MAGLAMNMHAFGKVEGRAVSGVTISNKTYGIFSIPATTDNRPFHKLVGMVGPNGVFVWVHKNYRKAL